MSSFSIIIIILVSSRWISVPFFNSFRKWNTLCYRSSSSLILPSANRSTLNVMIPKLQCTHQVWLQLQLLPTPPSCPIYQLKVFIEFTIALDINKTGKGVSNETVDDDAIRFHMEHCFGWLVPVAWCLQSDYVCGRCGSNTRSPNNYRDGCMLSREKESQDVQLDETTTGGKNRKLVTTDMDMDMCSGAWGTEKQDYYSN